MTSSDRPPVSLVRLALGLLETPLPGRELVGQGELRERLGRWPVARAPVPKCRSILQVWTI